MKSPLTVRRTLMSLALTCIYAVGALAQTTPPPAKILYFEKDDTQFLYVEGKFTWSQAMKMPTSVAITDPFGKGWLLAPIFRPLDFTHAAEVIKAAQGDLRDASGPYIGVIQMQGAAEPSDGWVNLDGSVPFVTWGKHDPNDGARIHSNILRQQAFHDALKQGAGLLLNYYTGKDDAADKADKIIDFAVSEISKPEGDRPKEDVAALFHEKDGSVVTEDLNIQKFHSVLLSRQKPTVLPPLGKLPGWPKVDGKTDLTDRMKVSRRSNLTWKWTNGARLGQMQVVNTKSGVAIIDRQSAATTAQALTILQPGAYMLRLRNITALTDPWLEISIVIY